MCLEAPPKAVDKAHVNFPFITGIAANIRNIYNIQKWGCNSFGGI
jgi:hypothetical protein